MLVLLCAGRAEAQLASPGPLARAHGKLEGLSNCVKCHPAGKQLSADNCLACHIEIKKRIDGGRGFHGHLSAGALSACNTCHKEHEGRDAPLIEWTPSKERFDHGKTGWPLRGKHAAQKCAQCHEPRRVIESDAQLLLRRGAETYLGVGTACSNCHFDEHRGQVGRACEQCHGESAWKPPPGFNHGKTNYPLLGKHAAVACAKCHPSITDGQQHPPFPVPRDDHYLRLSPIDHDRCTDCHVDPHEGRFGPACESCHTVEGWGKIVNRRNDRAFHDRTRFPLKGMHETVPCDGCHRPVRGRPAKFKGLAFGKCRDCHADAHGGQLADPTCERCHTVDGFRPSRYELEDHQKTRYPLLGAHAGVACTACHPTRALPTAVPERRRGAPTPPKLAGIVFRLPGKGDRCERCHPDPHGGQLSDPRDERGCARCHEVESWHKLRFDHARTRMPLTGAHIPLACDACHQRQIVGEEERVRYKPIDPGCATCHADVHLGQLAGPCERCHVTERFAQTKFNHNDRRFTTYPLEGKHSKVICSGCHRRVSVDEARKLSTQRFRPLPRDCEVCHVDFHRGDFRALPAAVLMTAAGPPRPPTAAGAVRCDLCHRVASWDEISFPHERTGFPLNGAHHRVTCKACHSTGFRQHVSPQCAGCHKDVHAAEFGKRCEGCHDEENWRTTFNVDAHRATNFPLAGRHALIPCTECHPNARDRGFSRAATQCTSCHQADYDRAATLSVDHARAGFSTECRACHNSFRWKPARYPSHDRCFRISSGPHAGIRCEGCHISIPSPQTLSSCMSNNAACTSCHTHDKARTDGIHAQRGVPGYSYQDRKCYECHTGA